MVNFFKAFFINWWRPIIFWFLACLIFCVSQIWSDSGYNVLAYIIFAMGLLLIFIAAIYQLINRKWLAGIVSFVLWGGTCAAYVLYIAALFAVNLIRGIDEPDPFAKNLTIPTDIAIDVPVDVDFDHHRPDSVTNRTVTTMDFQLYNSFQPGLFEYDFWIGNIESGTIYLKAFEITQEYALSTDRLPGSSSLKIVNTTGMIKKFSTDSHFTIYEGDWGEPYAARFEVWFKPDSDGPEQKLLTKNYKIEGWMR